MKHLLIIIFYIIFFKSFSQDTTQWYKKTIIGFNYMQGEVRKKESSNLPPFKTSTYYDVNILWQTTGNKDWQQHYYYPEIGFGFLHGNLGNDSIIGQISAVYPTFIIKSLKSKVIGFDFRFGLGFAYFNKPYNRLTNSANDIIGSMFTNFTKLGVCMRVSPIKKLSLYTGFDFIHCSNGHTRIPNLGLNDLVYTVGARYNFNELKLKKTEQTIEIYKYRFNCRIGLGMHEFAGSTFPTGSPLYPVYTLTPYISKRLSKINDLHIGIGAAYYTSFYDYMRVLDLHEGKENLQSCVFNIMLGHEFLVSHFGILTEGMLTYYNPLFEEIYLTQDDDKNAFNEKKYFSTRIGIIYYPLQSMYNYRHNVGIGLCLKTLFGQADFVEWNITYRL